LRQGESMKQRIERLAYLALRNVGINDDSVVVQDSDPGIANPYEGAILFAKKAGGDKQIKLKLTDSDEALVGQMEDELRELI